MTLKKRTPMFRLAAFCLVFSSFPLVVPALELGPLDIGGAIRANYIYGDYSTDGSGSPQRGGGGGDFELDTFRINLDLQHEAWLGKAEYRWYRGYNFLHTGWLGFENEDLGRIELGLTRVPFGVGPYGPANSWFFDQHYYLGLSDKMRLGAKYTRSFGDLTLDLAYFALPTFNGKGTSDESVRYSYAVVPEDVYDVPGSYEESHQLNTRGVYQIEELSTALGFSAQWMRLNATDGRARDADAFAASLHSSSRFGPVGLMLQLTSYKYDTDYVDAAACKDLIVMGAYDFAWPAATQGLVPSAALSYTLSGVEGWFDSITFYNDFSIILKNGELNGVDFNDSALNVTGMAIAKGNWYIYVDYALSNGNYFVGDDGDDYGDGESIASASVSDFGVTGNDDWKGRFNINFGYYF